MTALGRLDLTGTVALVTGGRGIGAACCRLLADRGADVAVGCRRFEDAAARVIEGIEAAGRRGVVVRGDVADPDDAARMIDETVAALGGLDILVNNAGILHRGALGDESVAERQRPAAGFVTGDHRCQRWVMDGLRMQP